MKDAIAAVLRILEALDLTPRQRHPCRRESVARLARWRYEAEDAKRLSGELYG